jgi:hypothetical protein
MDHGGRHALQNRTADVQSPAGNELKKAKMLNMIVKSVDIDNVRDGYNSGQPERDKNDSACPYVFRFSVCR